MQQHMTEILRTYSLVEDYIMFSDAGVKLHEQAFDLIELFTELWSEWREVAKKKLIAFHLTIEPRHDNQHPFIRSDKGRIRKCVIAVIENAIQNTQEDGEIFMHVLVDRASFALTVIDSGIGMSTDALYILVDRLKEGSIAFQQSTSTGLGISLALTYHTVVRLMGGQMRLQNVHESPPTSESDGAGSSFQMPMYQFADHNQMGFLVQLSIPFHDESIRYYDSRSSSKDCMADVNTNEVERRPSVFTNPSGPVGTIFDRRGTMHYNGETINIIKRENVLIVDDNDVNLKLLDKLLQHSGHKKILSATNGHQAAVIYQKMHQSISIVLTDLAMPIADGFDLAVKIRGFEKSYSITPGIPIVAISASGSDPELEEKCFKYGMQDLVSKPIGKALVQKIMTKWSLN
jgi:CheY-like chemotaxis protein